MSEEHATGFVPSGIGKDVGIEIGERSNNIVIVIVGLFVLILWWFLFAGQRG